MSRLAPFELHRVHSVAEAGRLIDELGDEAVIYSGGTELLLLMKLGFARFEHLVDIKPIDELGRLEVRDDGWLVIGSTVTHRRLERAPLLVEHWPDLVEMEQRVANVRVRSTGTLGGNLAFADPHSDPATFLLAAGAMVTLGRGEAQRSMPLDDFVLGPYETALGPGELLCSIEIPPMAAGEGVSHLRFAFKERPAATVSAWVQVREGSVHDARLAVGSVGERPVLVPGTADACRGQDASALSDDAVAALGNEAVEAAQPVGDGNGAADYKAALVRTLASRALREAAARAASRMEPSA